MSEHNFTASDFVAVLHREHVVRMIVRLLSWYEGESHTVCIPICLHMECLHSLANTALRWDHRAYTLYSDTCIQINDLDFGVWWRDRKHKWDTIEASINLKVEVRALLLPHISSDRILVAIDNLIVVPLSYTRAVFMNHQSWIGMIIEVCPGFISSERPKEAHPAGGVPELDDEYDELLTIVSRNGLALIDWSVGQRDTSASQEVWRSLHTFPTNMTSATVSNSPALILSACLHGPEQGLPRSNILLHWSAPNPSSGLPCGKGHARSTAEFKPQQLNLSWILLIAPPSLFLYSLAHCSSSPQFGTMYVRDNVAITVS